MSNRGRETLFTLLNRIRSWGLLLAIAALVLTPIGALLYGAIVTDSPGSEGSTFTLSNLGTVYGGLLTGDWTQSALVSSIALAIPVMGIACAVGVFLAWVVTRTDMPGRRLFEHAFLLPMLYSPLVGVIGWSVLADPQAGLLNAWWKDLTGSVEPVINIYSHAGIVWVMVLYFVPYAFILNVGAFRAMDPALDEAAAISGANLFQRLTRITLPIMLGSIAAAALFIFTLALEQFAIPGFLGSHIRFQTLAYAIYERTNAYPSDLPGAAAAGTLLLMLTTLGLYCYRRLMSGADRFVTVTARASRAGVTRLGALRLGFFALCLAFLVVGTAVPLGAVALRSLMPVRTTRLDLSALSLINFTDLLDGQDLLVALQNSILLAAGAATLCILLGMLWNVGRRTRIQSRRLAVADYLVAMPLGVPGTVFGVGMLWAYVGTPLYLTTWILLLAFVTRYLVYGVRTIGGGMLQIDKSLEEAAAVAGAPPVQTFLFVDLPLLKPIVASTWLLVFLIVMREISASVILYGVTSVTLPILTWSYLLDGSYGIASALAIVQLSIVAVIVVAFRLVFGVDVKSRSVD